jgi:lipopolysaccharide heptosyltransferase II
MKILVRGTNWLGDAVMTTPALLRLREKFPDAHITMFTPEKFKELWLPHPAVHEIITFTPNESVFSVGLKLKGRAGKHDLALIFPNSPRSAIETWVSGIPQRVGYARPWRNVFLTNAIPSRANAVKMDKRSAAEIRRFIHSPKPQISPPASAHQMHEYLNLVAAVGANPDPLPPQLSVLPWEIEAVKQKFGLADFRKPIFGLNPGAEYGPAKRWPVDRFITAACEIQRRTDCTWILFGGKSDAQLAAQIQTGMQNLKYEILNLAGKTSLRELMSLLKLCRVLLTNDTGPMHVAAALGTPVVVPFGSTSPELTGPGLPGDARNHLLKSDAPCSPCFLRECPIDFRCMNGISVESVVEAVVKSLNG